MTGKEEANKVAGKVRHAFQDLKHKGAALVEDDDTAGAVVRKGERKKRVLQDRASAVVHHPATFAIGTVVATYVAIKGTIGVFHHTRRSFLRNLLLDLCPALDAVGQIYWLDFGSLLGIHRGGDLILHDNDIDVAVLNPDWPVLLEKLKKQLPDKYSLKVVTPKDKPESSWIRVYCPLGMADLFGAYDEGNSKVFVDCGHGDTMHIEKSLVLPTNRKQWRGCNVSVPHDLEGTLVVRYGPTWRTPAYMEKGADTVEGNKPYARLYKALAKLGIRI